jgi:hypothetical protein
MNRMKKAMSDLEEIAFQGLKLIGFLLTSVSIILLECWTIVKIWKLISGG